MGDTIDLTNEQLVAEAEKLDFDSLGYTKLAGSKKVETPVAQPPALKKASLPPSQFKTNLERFHFVCKDLPSPDIFIDFNFYFMISACAARRVWFAKGAGDDYKINLNLYQMFVGPPGIGKSLPARYVGKLLSSLVDTKLNKNTGKFEELRLLNLGPDAITYEKLVKRAAQATDTIKLPDGKMYHHASTTFCLADEIDNLFTDSTKRVVSFLRQGYDCGDFEGDNVKDGIVKIRNICINFLGCTTPDLMRDLKRTGVLNNGFFGRFILIHGDKKRAGTPPYIRDGEEEKIEKEYLRQHLRKVAKITPGIIRYSPAAIAWYDDWFYNLRDKHLNDSPLLVDYYARKEVQLQKFAMVHMLSEPQPDGSLRTEVEPRDFIAASSLLGRAEPSMHKALGGSAENMLANLADDIKSYIQAEGSKSINMIILKFFKDGKSEDIMAAIDFLKATGQVSNCTVGNGKPGIRITGKNNKIESEENDG